MTISNSLTRLLFSCFVLLRFSQQAFHNAQSEQSRRLREQEEAQRKLPIADDSQFLNFPGVDPQYASRVAEQKQQQQQWLAAQLAVQEAREERERAEAARFEHAQLSAQAALERVHRAKEDADKAERKALADAHLSQAEEARLRREFLKQQEQRASAAEIEAQHASALLNELGQQRRDHSGRPLPAEFKGFNQTQRQVRNENHVIDARLRIIVYRLKYYSFLSSILPFRLLTSRHSLLLC